VCSLGMPNQEKAFIRDSDKLCSVLSVKGKKVLHIDRNDHYGGYVSSPPEVTFNQADKK